MIGCPDCGGPANQPAGGCTNPIHDEAKSMMMVPDAEGVMHLVQHEVLMDDQGIEAMAAVSALHKFILEQGGTFTIAFKHEDEGGAREVAWGTMLNFGRESEDSPMAAGSALGSGATAIEAIKEMMAEAKIDYEVPE